MEHLQHRYLRRFQRKSRQFLSGDLADLVVVAINSNLAVDDADDADDDEDADEDHRELGNHNRQRHLLQDHLRARHRQCQLQCQY